MGKIERRKMALYTLLILSVHMAKQSLMEESKQNENIDYQIETEYSYKNDNTYSYNGGNFYSYDNHSNISNAKFEGLTTLNGWVVDLSKYTRTPNTEGFGFRISSKRYTIEDLFTPLALKWGFDTPQKAYEAFVGVMIADGGNKTPDDILSSVSVALNRCELNNYVNAGTNEHDTQYSDVSTDGSNPFDQMFRNYGASYRVITNLEGKHPYQSYMPSIVGLESVNSTLDIKRINTPEVCTYEQACSVINDALFGGLRNSDFSGMRAFGYQKQTAKALYIHGGGWYQNENPDAELPQIEKMKELRTKVSLVSNPYYIGADSIIMDPQMQYNNVNLMQLSYKR